MSSFSVNTILRNIVDKKYAKCLDNFSDGSLKTGKTLWTENMVGMFFFASQFCWFDDSAAELFTQLAKQSSAFCYPVVLRHRRWQINRDHKIG